MAGVERPDAVVVHRQGVHASSCSERPDLDRLVGRGRHDPISVSSNQDVSDVVCVAHKFRDRLSRFRIPDSDHALRATAGEDR